MSSSHDVRWRYTRRGFLGTTLALASGATASFLHPAPTAAADVPPELKLRTYNGGTEPYPIPWLDKNGSHNQPAGPRSEPSHVYHFKGRVARCADFVGMGTEEVKVPSIDFAWASDPLSTSHANFAIIGQEVNGRYYSRTR